MQTSVAAGWTVTGLALNPTDRALSQTSERGRPARFHQGQNAGVTPALRGYLLQVRVVASVLFFCRPLDNYLLRRLPSPGNQGNYPCPRSSTSIRLRSM